MITEQYHRGAYSQALLPPNPVLPGSSRRMLLLTAVPGDCPTTTAVLAQALRQHSNTVHSVDFWSLLDERIVEAVSAIDARLCGEQLAFYTQLCQRNNQYDGRALLSSNAPPSLSFDIAGYEDGDSNLLERVMLIAWQAVAVTAAPTDPVWQGLRVWVRALLLGRLKKVLSQYDPDVIIVTQSPCASLLAAVKVGPLRHVPLLGVVPPQRENSDWHQLALDGYCVASETDAAHLRAQGIPAQYIHVVGLLSPDAADNAARIAAFAAQRCRSAAMTGVSQCLS